MEPGLAHKSLNLGAVFQNLVFLDVFLLFLPLILDNPLGGADSHQDLSVAQTPHATHSHSFESQCSGDTPRPCAHDSATVHCSVGAAQSEHRPFTPSALSLWAECEESGWATLKRI